MKKLFKLFILLNIIIASLLAVCPDRPTVPSSNIPSGLLITSTSDGISHFPTSTKQFSITLVLKTTEGCTFGINYFISMSLTPSGGGTPEDFTVAMGCTAGELFLISPWVSTSEVSDAGYGSDTALFLSFDLNIKNLRIEFQRSYKKVSLSQALTFTSDLSFDSNTKFYLCSDKNGASSKSCIISEFIFEYRYYGEETEPYTHLAGTYRIISEKSSLLITSIATLAAFYPFLDESFASSTGSASPAYFGDSESSPTTGTTPTWDPSSSSFVTISSGQFVTIPLPTVQPGTILGSFSLSFSAWVKITSIPSESTTIFALHQTNGEQVGFKLQVAQSSRELELILTPLTMELSGTPPIVTLNQWQLIGFTALFSKDMQSAEGTVFVGASYSQFYIHSYTDLDLSPLKTVRIGGADAANSFSGEVFLGRLTTPGGGFIRTTDTCSSENSIELGVESFALDCTASTTLDPTDNLCYQTCSTGKRSALPFTDAPIPLCLPCPNSHCATCDSVDCLTCETTYLLYQGDCLGSCPPKTYLDGTACHDCPSHCSSCDDSTECLICETNYLFYQGDCLGSCPAKTYSDGTACQDCSSPCVECDSNECLTCETNLLLYQGDCLGSCPAKTYSDGTACQDCSANCGTCDDSAECLTCETNYLLYQGDCVGSCPAKTFSTGSACQACSDHCTECEASGCNVCDDGYKLGTNKKCVSTKPSAVTIEESGLSGGAIAGIICGVLLATALCSISILRVIKKKKPSVLAKNSARDTTKTPPNLRTSAYLETKIISTSPTEEKPLMP